MSAVDDDPRQALVYNEAVRTLEQQQAVIESIRTRAGILLSAAAIATAFLSGIVVTKHRLDVLGWLATVAFVGVVGLCMAILWPTREWKFRANPKKLVRDYVLSGPSRHACGDA
jgi:hypothetical protein